MVNGDRSPSGTTATPQRCYNYWAPMRRKSNETWTAAVLILIHNLCRQKGVVKPVQSWRG